MPRKKRRRPHGFGCAYERTPGNWWIKWREGGRIRYGHGYASKEIAEKVLAKITSDISTGKAGLAPAPKEVPTLAELALTWLERRERTHRSADMDRYRWGKHLAKTFGGLRPAEVDAGVIRQFIEAKLASKLSSTTVLLCVRLLSTFFSDLVERGLAPANPVGTLPRSTRRLIRPAHDPSTTPFLEKLDDVRRVHRALSAPLHVAFAVGALAGLRTGEVFALKWANVDLDARRIRVRESVGGPLKDDEARVVPIVDALLPVLRTWREKSGGTGLVAPSRRGAKHIDAHTPGKALRGVLEQLDLPEMTWYQATRHTFASQWVLAGNSIEMLGDILGHSSMQVTQRYAHLRPDLYSDRVMSALSVDLNASSEE